MAEIKHEFKIEGSLEAVYKALATLEGLQAWHSLQIEGDPKEGGILNFGIPGKPFFKWKVLKSVPDKQVIWECIEGPGNSAGTKAIYHLSKVADGRTLLEFSHDEWPNEAGNFRKCNSLWGVLLHYLKNYVESGKPAPAYT